MADLILMTHFIWKNLNSESKFFWKNEKKIDIWKFQKWFFFYFSEKFYINSWSTKNGILSFFY